MNKMFTLSSLVVCLISAQVSFAAITGQVKNTNRVPIPGAVITFTSESNSDETYSAVTNDNGEYSIDYTPVAVDEATPNSFALHQNYPNPFNPSTTIPFSMAESGFINISIYNIMGQKIRTLVSDNMSAGSYKVLWNGCDAANRNVSAGIYFYQLKSNGMSESRKMLLLDGGAHNSVGHADPQVYETHSHSIAKAATTFYNVTITGDGFARFGKSGVTLTDGETKNFTVFPNNGLIVSNIITSGSTDISYISTIGGLDIGTHTNENAYEIIATYPGVFVYDNMVLVSEDNWGDTIYQYYRDDTDELTLTGSYTKPPGATSTDVAFVSTTKAYLSLKGAGKILVINPTELIVTDEIDVTEYAVGDDDFNPEPIDMVIRDNKLYVALHQEKSMYVHQPAAYVLIIDMDTNTVDKMISDTRTSSTGWYSSGQVMFVDDYGDLYVGGMAMFGMGPADIHPGILRIKNGETEFDPDYFFDLTETSLPDVPGNMGIYIYPTYLYTGGSTMYSYCMVPGLMSDPPDYAHDRPTAAFKFDLAAKTAEKIGVGYTNAYGIGLCAYKDKIVFGLTTVAGDGLYTYDPQTGESTVTPVVTTVGYPMVLKAF